MGERRDLPAARQAFASADEHWEQGEGGDPAGLLDGTRRLDLKASLLKVDGQPEQALALLEEALQGMDTDPARGRLLLQKAVCKEIKELAEEMLWIFKGQKVHKEALAALALFRQAARAEEANAEWTRRLVKYLYKAQHNPRLRFLSPQARLPRAR